MIKVTKEQVVISGEMSEVLSECTKALRELYTQMSKAFGEEFANEQLVKVGRLAVASEEELHKIIKE